MVGSGKWLNRSLIGTKGRRLPGFRIGSEAPLPACSPSIMPGLDIVLPPEVRLTFLCEDDYGVSLHSTDCGGLRWFP